MYNFDYDLDAELHKFKKYRDTLEPFIIDTVCYVNKSLGSGMKILAEGTVYPLCFCHS
jgi:adenylosuccinate synthase